MKLKSLLCLAGLAVSATTALGGPISYSGGLYSQNFDSLSSSGTANAWANGSTIEGWYFYRIPAPGVAISSYRASAGTDTTGAFFSFGNSDDRALGAVGSGNATAWGGAASNAVAGWFAVGLTNSTGLTQSQFTISFNGEQWRNGGNASAQTMVLEYGFGASFDTVSTWLQPGGTFNWASPVVGASAAAVDGNAAGKVTNIGGTISGLSWAPGDTLWIRWVERNDAGNDHGLAIDDFTFTNGEVFVPPAISKTVIPTFTTIQTVPADVTYAISNISNSGSSTAAGSTITATFPANVSYNAAATTPGLPAGVTVSFTAPTLTVNLGDVAAGGTVPNFNVVMTASTAFANLDVTWASAPGSDTDPTSVLIFNNTNTIQTNDVIAGMSTANIPNTLQLLRPATNSIIPEAYNISFIQSVEFDNKDLKKSNPLGNLLGVNFGTETTGGLVYVFPTQSLGTASGQLIGSWTDDNTFAHSATSTAFDVTSPAAKARMNGISVSFCNDKVALSGFENGGFYVFDYANTGDGQASLSNGRINLVNASNVRTTVGTTWIDNTHFVAAQPTASGIIVSVFEATATAITLVNSASITGETGFSFTDVEYNPGVPAPLNNKLIVSASKFVSNVNTNKIWVFDIPTSGGGYAVGTPIVNGADYSSSANTLREIALDSNGNLWLGEFGGSTTSPANTLVVDTVAFASDVAVMFAGNNSVDAYTFPAGTSSTFNGLDVAAGTTLPACEVVAAGCSPADIAYGDGEPLPPIGQPGGFNPEGPDGGDFDCFFNFYFAPAPDNAVCDIAYGDGEPLPPYGQPGGFNPGVDGGDFDCFFNYYFNGCL